MYVFHNHAKMAAHALQTYQVYLPTHATVSASSMARTARHVSTTRRFSYESEMITREHKQNNKRTS